MKLTAELSLYPLREGHIEAIESFIQASHKKFGRQLLICMLIPGELALP